MEKKPFDNRDRTRYYGVRVGDTVKLCFMPGKKQPLAEVVGYGGFDNNRVYVKVHGEKKTIDWVAEWCDVVIKVENKYFW